MGERFDILDLLLNEIYIFSSSVNAEIATFLLTYLFLYDWLKKEIGLQKTSGHIYEEKKKSFKNPAYIGAYSRVMFNKLVFSWHFDSVAIYWAY